MFKKRRESTEEKGSLTLSLFPPTDPSVRNETWNRERKKERERVNERDEENG